ncbi:hypothetical protein JG687_00010377 [Phytophthora cactorum]|uniref:Uncharacterized protein n=1 Tax=Phytophthora cactorum TaxID=29920 RepID=A0A8T1U955_9STRA|nr:hypothetical protein JG687_00010377 [Phytophthora cactorum]
MRYTCCAWPRFPSFELKNPSAKRTPLKPSHLKIRRIPDRPHAASQKMAFRARWCELKNAGWFAMRNQPAYRTTTRISSQKIPIRTPVARTTSSERKSSCTIWTSVTLRLFRRRRRRDVRYPRAPQDVLLLQKLQSRTPLPLQLVRKLYVVCYTCDSH